MSHLIKKLREDSDPSPYRIWYNEWVAENAIGKVLDVGKSQFWDYGFPAIDTDPRLKPTFIGDISRTSFPDGCFDWVLCNGMYEWVDDPQKMVDECLRIGKRAIFGFVGRAYHPYKKDWKFFNENINFHGETERKDFSNSYHFIIK